MQFRARTGNVAWRVVEGEAVLVHADTSAYYGLNRTGTVLWKALAENPRGSEELARGLTERLDAPQHQARQDVDDFLARLAAAGLITQSDERAHHGASNEWSAVAPVGPYEPPHLAPFGELEQLILSGE